MKFHLYRIYLNQDGYDSDGTYWGSGQPLYHYESKENEDYIRANDRDHAKQIIRAKYPTTEFYN